MTGVGVELHLDERKRKTKMTMVMDLQSLLRSTECRDVDHLHKLLLIGGRAGSNWIFQNFQEGCKLRNFWIG
jgi:hypothetical protein